MKLRIKLLVLVCTMLLGSCYAQIVAVTGAAGGGTCIGSGTSCSLPATQVLNIAVGDTIVVVQSGNNTSGSPAFNGCGLTFPAPIVNSTSGSQPSRLWVIEHATTAQTGCNIQVTGIAGAHAFALQRYQNVVSIGAPVTNLTQTPNASTWSAPTINAADGGNYIVGLFFSNTVSGGAFTPASGTNLRRANGNTVNAVGIAIADIGPTSAGQAATVTVSPTTAGTYKSASIEFTGPAVNREAHLDDAGRTMVMNAPNSMAYQLPPTGLSSTWCTWFMPVGPAANDYELDPTSGNVNGQNRRIRIPSWQMTRVCQDANGAFWASPPLLAGTGISITPSATGLTISSGPGGMTYIAGGTTTIPGNVAVAPDTCATLYTITSTTTPSATGVESTDVVSWSLHSAAGSTGWTPANVYVIPGDNQIVWRGCNPTSTSTTPSSRGVNWYVLRHSASAVAAQHRARSKKVVRPKK